MSVHVPDDPRIATYGQDSGYCGHCGSHIDNGCECTDEEREDPSPQGCTCPIWVEDCCC